MSGTTTTTQFTNVHAREVDFVTRFGANWEMLTNLLGIMNPIKKEAGTTLRTGVAVMIDNALVDSPAEGQTITATQFGIEETDTYDITIEKYSKEVSVEAVAKYGAVRAVEKTDEEFLNQLQLKTLNAFYAFIKCGTLTGKATTWQMCLSRAKGAVINKFAGMNKTVTEVVGFATINDAYKYLGEATVSVQTMFGVQYLEDFMGYKTLFLLPDTALDDGTVIALPTDNIDLYYIDPADSQFKQLGLDYTVAGDTHLIGFHVEGKYGNATGASYALMGMKLWAEYIDGICKMTIDATASDPVVATGAGIGMSDGVTPKKTKAAASNAGASNAGASGADADADEQPAG